jgi:hypothetical protein
MNANVIGTLKQGTEVIICNKDFLTDSLNGVKASWVPILYNGLSGYVWGYSLATNYFTHSNGNKLLVKNDKQGLSYKIFARDSIISSGTYSD